jgi:hypothetical protein
MRNEKIKKEVYSSPDALEWSSYDDDEMSGTCQHTREVNCSSLAENMECIALMCLNQEFVQSISFSPP